MGMGVEEDSLGLLDENEQIEESFRKKRRLRLTLLVLRYVFAFVMLGGFLNALEDGHEGMSPDGWVWIAILVLIATSIVTRFQWRCPACSRHLGRSLNPKHCQNCGVKLQ
jgi:hypothetical protein